MSKRNFILTITALSLCESALGQPGVSSVSNRQPTGAPPNTQLLMQASGGSLLQGTLASSPPDITARVPAYSMFSVPEPEPKVLRKHDLVNILVQEVSQFESTGTTDLKKNADLDAKIDQWISLKLATLSVHGTGQAQNPVEMKMEGQRDFKGDATVDRNDTVTLRIEAEIIDVKPNGTLVVQAKKHIKTDEEEQTIILTGTCRVQDVDATNSVLSTDLHDLDVQKATKGAVRDTNKRGLLPRLLDFINPF